MQEMEKEQKMKKSILIFALLLCLLLCSCGATVTNESDNTSDNTSMFVRVEATYEWWIVYHKDTKVMYAVSIGQYNNGNFTLLVNADGTPMVYEGGSGK